MSHLYINGEKCVAVIHVCSKKEYGAIIQPNLLTGQFHAGVRLENN